MFLINYPQTNLYWGYDMKNQCIRIILLVKQGPYGHVLSRNQSA